ncbi:Dihydrolipoyllysine-residue acetyltransferase component of pyruvate dehydrogenase complex [Thalassocella blandensis]|nr:Dihydrolipoyllysine-residue acetyltransferase component of pyruvate dehydrogenase complex [Thalassocella blandensis]
MAKQTVAVPDIGGAENVDVIEVCVAPGDVIAEDDAIVVLESDKASMDIPSPFAGKIVSIAIKEGDTVNEGDAILEIETEAEVESEVKAEEAPAPAPKSAPAKSSAGGAELPVTVPDIGGAEGVDVIEICVAVGDSVAEGDSIIVLESDKASMDIPAPASGTVKSIGISEGDKVSEGDAIMVLTTEGEEAPAASAESAAPVSAEQSAPAASGGGVQDVTVPDIGGAEEVDVIEVCVAEGDEVSEGDSIIVLESDKASMDIPSPASGKVVKLQIKEGDKASEGSAILQLEVAGAAAPAPAKAEAPAQTQAASSPAPAAKQAAAAPAQPQGEVKPSADVYAGPAVRKLARQLGVDLGSVPASGPKGRMSKDDVKAYVKSVLSKASTSGGAAVASGAGIPQVPAIDFSKFGEIETVKMTKIHQVTAANMSRAWLNVPHVTQFDDADITDLEDFRKGMKAEAEKAGVKLTPLPFLLKACAAALQYEPSFNVSLHSDGQHIVKKKYVHIGVAVATPNGLMVPVIRDVDQKGLFELAKESTELAKKARDGKLKPNEMQGACFTISSLGPIGGTGFTPIVNTPEVGILGVSKAAIKPVWDGSGFIPRQMLPLCLSYDHRAINGADAGNFMTYLVSVLNDVRKLLV